MYTLGFVTRGQVADGGRCLDDIQFRPVGCRAAMPIAIASYSSVGVNQSHLTFGAKFHMDRVYRCRLCLQPMSEGLPLWG